MSVRNNLRDIAINLAAQALWVVSVLTSTALLVLLFGTTNAHKILDSQISVPAWAILAAAVLVMLLGVAFFFLSRKASAVRGRQRATRANLALLRERHEVERRSPVVRSTRFGRWPQSEVLPNRVSFRHELDSMILKEGIEVRRIWNVSSRDDAVRLTEMLQRYEGRANHSIRAYFKIPDHALPELLIVDHRGASMSFPSSRSPKELDWMIRFNRADLIGVVQDYFEVLWDRADRVLDAGEIVDGVIQRLNQIGREFDGQSGN